MATLTNIQKSLFEALHMSRIEDFKTVPSGKLYDDFEYGLSDW